MARSSFIHKESGGVSNAAALQEKGGSSWGDSVCARVCRRGTVAHVSGQTGVDFKACPSTACVGTGVCTRNLVAIQEANADMLPCVSMVAWGDGVVRVCAGEGQRHTLPGGQVSVSRGA